MSICRNCIHNTYRGNARIADWVSCDHPITLQKMPRPEPGDPAWLDVLTGDAKVGGEPLGRITECAAFASEPMKTAERTR